jgi:hypothetical protein
VERRKNGSEKKNPNFASSFKDASVSVSGVCVCVCVRTAVKLNVDTVDAQADLVWLERAEGDGQQHNRHNQHDAEARAAHCHLPHFRHYRNVVR